MKYGLIAGLFAIMAFATGAQAEDTVRLYAAGSLKAAMTDIGAAYTKDHGAKESYVCQSTERGLMRAGVAKQT